MSNNNIISNHNTDNFPSVFPEYNSSQNQVTAVVDSQWIPMMQALGICPTTNPVNPYTPSALVQQHTKTQLASQNNQLQVEFLGYAPVFTGTHLFPAEKTDWVMMNLVNDPLYYTNGNRLIVPTVVKEKLDRILATGINFDAIYIAHEIPGGQVMPGEDVPLELIAPPPPPAVVKRSRELGRSSQSLWSFVQESLSKLAVVGKYATTTLALAPIAVASVPIALAATLDPILFGVNFEKTWRVDNQMVGMWYYLTHWYWPEQEEER